MQKTITLGVFLAGFSSLALEFSASRLLGNFFGTSNIVWASIIGLILVYLTLGYWIGGKWADRSPHEKTFFSILAWGAFFTALIPLISRPILRFSSSAFDFMQLGILLGSFSAVIILFSVPVVLMGMASPFALRIALKDADSSGRIAGQIYAISTLGSILGSFLPVLVLIPLIGTYRTFLVISAMLWSTSFIGLVALKDKKGILRILWMPFLIALCAFTLMQGTDKSASGIVFEGESAYNYIQVQEIDGSMLLRLNEGQGIHSIYNPDTSFYRGPWDLVVAAPFFNSSFTEPNRVNSAAILGLAAGTSARQLVNAFPQINILGIEIDPLIVETGRKFFAMNIPNLTVLVEDARWGLTRQTNLFDIIFIDAYRPPYIPPHLVTLEFFGETYQHLTETGVVVLNVARIADDRELINTLATTLQQVFADVYVVDIPDTFNSMIYATRKVSRPTDLISNYSALVKIPNANTLILETLQLAIANLQTEYQSAMVFTDDRAPIEWITNQMIIGFITQGGAHQLQ